MILSYPNDANHQTILVHSSLQPLMHKSEIQPLVSLIRRSLQIRRLLFLRHTMPSAIATTIPMPVIQFRANDDQHVPASDDDESCVACAVERAILLSIDLRG